MDWQDLIMPHLKQANYVKHRFTEEEKNTIRSFNQQVRLQ